MTTTLKSTVLAVALMAGGLAAGTAQAAPQHHGHPQPSHYHNYHVSYGYRFSHGYYFRGPAYNHYSYRIWNSRYGCYFYFYPGTNSYYYWSGVNNCYYPTTYITVVAPNGPAPVGVTTLPLQTAPVVQPSFQPPVTVVQPGYQQPGPVVQPGYQQPPMPVPYSQY